MISEKLLKMLSEYAEYQAEWIRNKSEKERQQLELEKKVEREKTSQELEKEKVEREKTFQELEKYVKGVFEEFLVFATGDELLREDFVANNGTKLMEF